MRPHSTWLRPIAVKSFCFWCFGLFQTIIALWRVARRQISNFQTMSDFTRAITLRSRARSAEKGIKFSLFTSIELDRWRIDWKFRDLSFGIENSPLRHFVWRERIFTEISTHNFHSDQRKKLRENPMCRRSIWSWLGASPSELIY